MDDFKIPHYDPQPSDKEIWGLLTVWVMFVMGNLALWIGAIWVIVHFARKWW